MKIKNIAIYLIILIGTILVYYAYNRFKSPDPEIVNHSPATVTPSRPPKSDLTGYLQQFPSSDNSYTLELAYLTGLTNDERCQYSIRQQNQKLSLNSLPPFIICSQDKHQRDIYSFKKWLSPSSFVVDDFQGKIEIIDVKSDSKETILYSASQEEFITVDENQKYFIYRQKSPDSQFIVRDKTGTDINEFEYTEQPTRSVLEIVSDSLQRRFLLLVIEASEVRQSLEIYTLNYTNFQPRLLTKVAITTSTEQCYLSTIKNTNQTSLLIPGCYTFTEAPFATNKQFPLP